MTTQTPPWRIPLLVLVCGGALVTLAKVLWWMPAYQVVAVPEVLDQAIALSEWQLKTQESLSIPEEKAKELRAVHRYLYTQDEQQLAIEMRYLERSDTNIRNLLLQYDQVTPTVPFESTIRQNEAGYYSLFEDGEHVYLSSCINPKGGTTVTAAQFTQNRYTYDLQLSRAIPVLLGQTSLQDSRCLWTHMAIPIAPGTPIEATYPILEASWEQWQTFWQANFPAS